jgi:hypothetical protein
MERSRVTSERLDPARARLAPQSVVKMVRSTDLEALKHISSLKFAKNEGDCQWQTTRYPSQLS